MPTRYFCNPLYIIKIGLIFAYTLPAHSIHYTYTNLTKIYQNTRFFGISIGS